MVLCAYMPNVTRLSKTQCFVSAAVLAKKRKAPQSTAKAPKSTAKARKSTQKHGESTQKHGESTQKHPKARRKHPEAPKSTQKHPKAWPVKPPPVRCFAARVSFLQEYQTFVQALCGPAGCSCTTISAFHDVLYIIHVMVLITSISTMI